MNKYFNVSFNLIMLLCNLRRVYNFNRKRNGTEGLCRLFDFVGIGNDFRYSNVLYVIKKKKNQNVIRIYSYFTKCVYLKVCFPHYSWIIYVIITKYKQYYNFACFSLCIGVLLFYRRITFCCYGLFNSSW